MSDRYYSTAFWAKKSWSRQLAIFATVPTIHFHGFGPVFWPLNNALSTCRFWTMDIPRHRLKHIVITIADDYEKRYESTDSDDNGNDDGEEEEVKEWIRHRWHVFVRQSGTNTWEVGSDEGRMSSLGYRALTRAIVWMDLWLKMDRIQEQASAHVDSDEFTWAAVTSSEEAAVDEYVSEDGHN